MNNEATNVDVLCVGHASYDLVFSVAKHPGSDEKVFADALISCGGGPAANAAIAVSKLGLKSAFAGYLGNDLYGDQHNQEFEQHSVNTDCLIQGKNPTPLSTIIVKPDGKRALINYKGSTTALSSNTIDFSRLKPKVILFDGHEPHISLALIDSNHFHDIPTVLDAGSLHEGSEKLANKVDYLVVSDGVFSNTKSVIEKKFFKPSYYGAIAIRTQIKTQDISNLNSNNISLIMGSDAHLVLYPINQQKELNLVCIIRKKTENNDSLKTILENTILKENKNLTNLFRGDLKSWPIYTSGKPIKSIYKNVLYIGDAMGDFPNDDVYKFGKKQFILPNPMYGKW